MMTPEPPWILAHHSWKLKWASEHCCLQISKISKEYFNEWLEQKKDEEGEEWWKSKEFLMNQTRT